MLPMDVDAILCAERAQGFAFRYEKDCYALSLLAHVIGGGRPIATLRRGTFARLFDKTIVKRALARATHGLLTPRCLEAALPRSRRSFLLTLDRWGDRSRGTACDPYFQTSRRGENVVMQLNFPADHQRAYRALVRPDREHPFASPYHPTRTTEPHTLAWARLDVDTEASEVLIEEVQCDWVKRAHGYAEEAREQIAAGGGHRPFSRYCGGTAAELVTYVDHVLAPFARSWEECVLSAAIELSYARFGARRLFFHTHDGGRVMKRLLPWSLPPRSLYTTLPERFCFTKTTSPPRMLGRDPRLRRRAVEWFRLDLV